MNAMQIETLVKDGIVLVTPDDLAATMLIRSFVSPEEQAHMTYQEAYDLALRRDEEAAHALEMSAAALFDNADDDETADAAAAINTLLETAALADEAASGVGGL